MECLGVSQYVFKVFNLMECYSKAVSSSIVVVVVVVAAAAAAAAAEVAVVMSGQRFYQRVHAQYSCS